MQLFACAARGVPLPDPTGASLDFFPLVCARVCFVFSQVVASIAIRLEAVAHTALTCFNSQATLLECA